MRIKATMTNPATMSLVMAATPRGQVTTVGSDPLGIGRGAQAPGQGRLRAVALDRTAAAVEPEKQIHARRLSHPAGLYKNDRKKTGT